MAGRICTTLSDHIIKEHRLDELKTRLLKRNYPHGVVTKGIENAKKIQVNELRTIKYRNELNQTQEIAFSMTYNQKLQMF